MSSPNIPYDLVIKAGQTVVLHDGVKIVMRAVAAKDTRYFTAWFAIVGTEAQVNATIAELGLQ